MIRLWIFKLLSKLFPVIDIYVNTNPDYGLQKKNSVDWWYARFHPDIKR